MFFLTFVATTSWSLERFDIITTEQLAQMVSDREAGKIDFILVNSLDEVIFNDSTIPGSVNIPLDRTSDNIHKLGTDKEKLVVSY